MNFKKWGQSNKLHGAHSSPPPLFGEVWEGLNTMPYFKVKLVLYKFYLVSITRFGTNIVAYTKHFPAYSSMSVSGRRC